MNLEELEKKMQEFLLAQNNTDKDSWYVSSLNQYGLVYFLNWLKDNE